MKQLTHILLILLISFNISYAQCNGDLALCSKTYDKVAYLTTHNAFNSDQDGLLFPNQTYNITSQMNDGVRALMIDVYDLFGTPTAYHSVFALGTIPLLDLFNNIKSFLENNPNEVLTIILECYVSANDIEDIVNQSGLNNYLYTHNNSVGWPTLQNMIENDNRLVIFTDENDANSSQLWYHYIWDYAVETHYNINTISDFNCSFNRGDPDNHLFILNHFITDANLGYGLQTESMTVNSNPFFINRALECYTQTNKFPNFITVDFYELGDGLNVVSQLNNLSTASNIDQHVLDKKIINIKNMLGQNTEVKNNSILFYLYDDGIVEKKIIIE